MKRSLVIGLILALAGPWAVAGEESQEKLPLDELLSPIDGLTVESERCVSLHRIDRTEIVDNQTILFYMRDTTVYVNYLPHSCPGLRRGKAFSYRTSQSKLCNVDLITVLENFGSRFTRGPSCGLGQFHPIGVEGAALLKEQVESGRIPDR